MNNVLNSNITELNDMELDAISGGDQWTYQLGADIGEAINSGVKTIARTVEKTVTYVGDKISGLLE